MKMYSSFLLLFFVYSLNAQNTTVEVKLDKTGKRGWYIHEVKPKETLYGITKTYGCTLPELMKDNNMRHPDLSTGQLLFVPFHSTYLSYDKDKIDKKDRITVLYEVKPRETVYGITRKFLDLNLTAIKELNNLKQNRLRIGQKLIIGYLKRYNSEDGYNISNDNEELITEHETPAIFIPGSPSDIEQISSTDTSVQIYSIDSENGVAFWDKQATGMEGHYVLHRHAAPNTWIELNNPMFDRKIHARVLGSIPDEMYPSDVLVVITPSIAKELGALDARFYVKVRYLRAQSTLTKAK